MELAHLLEAPRPGPATQQESQKRSPEQQRGMDRPWCDSSSEVQNQQNQPSKNLTTKTVSPHKSFLLNLVTQMFCYVLLKMFIRDCLPSKFPFLNLFCKLTDLIIGQDLDPGENHDYYDFQHIQRDGSMAYSVPVGRSVWRHSCTERIFCNHINKCCAKLPQKQL